MCFRIWQFSDTHLFADRQATLYDLNPANTLAAVLADASQAETQADLAVVTGDLVHDESVQGYQHFAEQLSCLKRPVYCLPGNHDDPGLMSRILNSGDVRVGKVLIHRHWQLIFIDSTLSGQVGGLINSRQLVHLEQCLKSHPDKATLVFLHHPPLLTGMAWLDDGQILENPEDLFMILERYRQVRGVCWGHAHQLHTSWHRDIQLLGCPSTMVQFKPDCHQFTLDSLGPAYRWLDCHDDGRLESDVIFLH